MAKKQKHGKGKDGKGRKARIRELEKQIGQVEDAISTHSSPSDLQITDLRAAVVCSNYDYPILRLDTNQGVYGIGEVRDAGHRENALQYKSFLLGQNPCNVDMIFRAIKHFGGPGREGGGVSGIELALWDLVGKVYGVPCYQFLGGKYRDRVRLYADTPSPRENTPRGYAERVAHRKALGLTLIKFDLMLHRLVAADEDVVLGKPSPHDYGLGGRGAARGRVGTQLTERGLGLMREIVCACREAAGPEIPLALDHFGPLTVKDGIRMGRALEGYGIAWLEDIMGIRNIKGNREVTEAIQVPTLNGEQGYLLKGLRKMIKTHAVDIRQPDLVTVGGMAELKRVADYADAHGMPTVLHCAGSPVMFMANIHCAAAIRSFIAHEIHSLDIPFWRDLVTGLDDPFMVDGYVRVPDKPGLGVDLNEEVIKEHLRYHGYFEPTDVWDKPALGWWIPPEQRDED